MRTGSLTAGQLDSLRFDAQYHLDLGLQAFRRVQSGQWPLTSPGEQFGESAIWSPKRFTRVYAAALDHGKPILVPYDTFRYLPHSRNYLSRSQVAEYERLELSRGWLLITCSGRNLGPVTLVDSHCARFVLSHDMIRVECSLTDELLYFTGFLRTPTGQALVRRDKNGSVIDHIGPEHVAGMRYPLVSDQIRDEVVRGTRQGFIKREEAREQLRRVRSKFVEAAELAESPANFTAAERRRRFAVPRATLTDRLDAEPQAPLYGAYRRRLIKNAGGQPLREIARVFKPAGRYKTLYVDDPGLGIPLMSGRQLAQYSPIGLKHMSPRAFVDPGQYLLSKGTVLLTADGRAEKNLADTVLLTSDRVGWMASGHVHRLTPQPGVRAGLVYLAASCEPVQAQLKALATGSVVDALSEEDVGSVVVPVPDNADDLAADAEHAWDLFAEAAELEANAISALQDHLTE